MPKYKGYKALSEGGTKYLDLSDERIYNQLTPAERKRLEHQAEWYREEVRLAKSEYYDTLESDFQRRQAIKRQQYILSGQSEEDALNTFFNNYYVGLSVRGENNLATMLEWVVAQYKSTSGKSNLYNDLPELTLFYADKRSRTGNTDTDIQLAGDDESTYEDVKEELVTRMRERGLPKYVIDFAIDGGFNEINEQLHAQGKSLKDLSLKELRYIAKNASKS